MTDVHLPSSIRLRASEPISPHVGTNHSTGWTTPSWSLLFSAFLILAGCTWPTLFQPATAAEHSGPSSQAQLRMLSEARGHIQHGRARKAIPLLQSLIETHPDSPFLAEMRWTLAQAYEQSGDLHAALKQYQLIVTATGGSRLEEGRYVDQAKVRISALEPNLNPARKGAGVHTAVLISPTQVPPRPELSQWLHRLSEAGVTTVVLLAGTPLERGPGRHERSSSNGSDRSPPQVGVYFRTQWASVVDDYIDQIVPAAHEQGVTVFAALTLRRMSWLEPPVGWADWQYDPAQQQLRRSLALDLFHPGFQEYLTGLLTDLADTGIDGVLFQGNAPIGPYDGFSPFATKDFRESFDFELDPAMLYIVDGQSATARPTEDRGLHTDSQIRYTPEFWRWAGWKAREQIRIMSDLTGLMRQRSPKLKFAVEVHHDAISDPVGALVRYTEDLVEANRAGFDFFVVGANAPHSGRSGHPANRDEQSEELGRLITMLADVKRVWVSKPLRIGGSDMTPRQLNPAADRANLIEDIGLLYIVGSPSVP